MTYVSNQILLFRPPDPQQASALLSHTLPMNHAYLATTLRTAGKTIRYERIKKMERMAFE